MAFAAEQHIGTRYSGDALDRALAIAWVTSQLAADTLGPFFWAALALLGLQAIS